MSVQCEGVGRCDGEWVESVRRDSAELYVITEKPGFDPFGRES